MLPLTSDLCPLDLLGGHDRFTSLCPSWVCPPESAWVLPTSLLGEEQTLLPSPHPGPAPTLSTGARLG